MVIKDILIIANIRCGGTYLMKSLAKTYSLNKVWEPNNLYHYSKPSVIKVNAAMHSMEALVEYSEYFSKVILLDRKDKKAQLESAVHMFSNNGVIDVKWVWKDNSYSAVTIKESKDRINSHTTRIKELSRNLKLPITYYEDIYLYGKKLKDLVFNPDPSEKLRMKPRKKTLN